MASDIRQRMDALKGTSARYVLAEFLKERIDDKTKQLISCEDTTFKRQQGRILELVELLKYIES